MTIRIATALIERDGAYLLVATRYPNHPEPLWNLPGGRQRPGELLPRTLEREVTEETGLAGTTGRLLYCSESYDRQGTHVASATFAFAATGEVSETADPSIVGSAWLPPHRLRERIGLAVIREPLLAYLAGDDAQYYGYADAGVTIEFATRP